MKQLKERVEALRALRGGGDAGASAAEYALMVGGIAALIVVVVFAFGGLVQDLNHENCTTIAATASPGSDCGP